VTDLLIAALASTNGARLVFLTACALVAGRCVQEIAGMVKGACRVIERWVTAESERRAESQRMHDFGAMSPATQLNYARLVEARTRRRQRAKRT